MAAGTPLDDDDRRPWLDRLRALLDAAMDEGAGTVLACSALKAAYRERLGARDPRVAFLFLDGDPAVIAARLEARRGHYMPAALLASQLATLEAPVDEAVRVDVAAAPDAVLAAALAGLTELDARRTSAASPTEER
jgi:carbohydrate kinase (thermoresistant glucokinase family)